jgi:hypothetical protein
VRPLPVRNAPRTLLAPLKGLLARVRALTTLFRSGSTFTPRRIGQRSGRQWALDQLLRAP